MSEVVLHIGPHKTGTTAIQEFLSRHHEALLAVGIDFPKLGRFERNAPGSQAHRHFSAYMRGAVQEYPDGFEAACRAGISTADLCILSSEDFYFGSRKADIARLFDLVPGIGRIIVFLRDPVAHVRSMYGEALKGSYARGLSDYYGDHHALLTNPKAGYAYYNYQHNIRRWATFAPVTEIVYDPSSNSLESFFAEVAPGFDPGTVDSPPGRLNVAAPPLIKALQLSINRSYATGRIDMVLYRTLKKRISRKGMAGLDGRYEAAMVETVTDTGPFRDAFCKNNPRLSHLCHDSPERIMAWELPSALDTSLIADMSP